MLASSTHGESRSVAAAGQDSFPIPLILLPFFLCNVSARTTHRLMQRVQRMLVCPEDLGPLGQVRRERVQPALRRQPGHGLRRRAEAERVQAQCRRSAGDRLDVLGRHVSGGVGDVCDVAVTMVILR